MMAGSVAKKAIEAYETVYDANEFEVTQAKYRKKQVVSVLNKYKPKHLVEVGCGWETIANVWKDFEQLTIIEPGPRFAQKAVHDTHRQKNIRVIEAFLEDATQSVKQKPDVLLLSSLLHEVSDVELFLQSAKAICGPETVVHINVPNAKSMHRLLAKEMGLIDSLSEQSTQQKHYNQTRIFDLESLKEAVTQSGFDVIEEGGFFIKPFTHDQMQKMCQSGHITNQMLDGFWGLAKYFPEHGSEIFVNLKLRSTT